MHITALILCYAHPYLVNSPHPIKTLTRVPPIPNPSAVLHPPSHPDRKPEESPRPNPPEIGITKMQYFRHFVASLLLSSLLLSIANCDNESSIYEVLDSHGLPRGLLPKGVTNFSLDNSGKFQVHLDQACNAKFEDEIHYDMNVSGTLQFGQIDDLSGISAQDLFLWFPVIEIRVDVPSSGLIYFNVGVVSKQFSLSSFETPRDCLAGPDPDLANGRHIVETVSKIGSGKLLQYGIDKDDAVRTTL